MCFFCTMPEIYLKGRFTVQNIHLKPGDNITVLTWTWIKYPINGVYLNVPSTEVVGK